VSSTHHHFVPLDLTKGQGAGLISETHAIIEWLRSSFRIGLVGVSGISMGVFPLSSVYSSADASRAPVSGHHVRPRGSALPNAGRHHSHHRSSLCRARLYLWCFLRFHPSPPPTEMQFLCSEHLQEC
jgi:hypothetical protein